FIKPLFWYQAVFADLCTIIEAFCILTNCINSFTWYFFQHPYFVKVPQLSKDNAFFKNEFTKELSWPVKWFDDDGAWPEMTSLAEKIAAAM
ncbi:MAG: hypothetical protein D3903_08840, partial [Candidatus Electrothrix sp. GM3_4]|nr:hypothetical protein [Candidatus Electrothrix sp. GM3_4]